MQSQKVLAVFFFVLMVVSSAVTAPAGSKFGDADEWFSQNSGTSELLWSVDFADANTGWAVGYGGTILKTTSGGANWNTQTSGTSNGLLSVDFTDANTGWAVGGDGIILKTTNGGADWNTQTSGTSNTLRSEI